MKGVRSAVVCSLTIFAFAWAPVVPAHATERDCFSYAYDCTPGYNGANASGTWAWTYYGAQYAQTPNGYHNCTLYAAWRLQQSGMASPGHSWGNAADWAGRIGGGNHSPAVGSIAWWGTERGGGFGHVAYVEQVSGGNVFIRADNYSSTQGYTDAGWIAASSVDLFLHPHDVASAGGSPLGSFDVVGSPGPGQVHVAGWAFDPDAPTTPIHVHVYVGGPAGSGAPGFDIGPTSVARPDVQAVYPQAGGSTGFDTTVSVNTGGADAVYVYGINVGVGDNDLIGTKSVNVADPNPLGSLDNADTPTPGQIHVRGWAFDPNDPTAPTHVHIYVGGPAGSGAPGFDIGPTSVTRPDVPGVFPQAGGSTGFDTSVPVTATGTYDVYAYAINVGPGDNDLIGQKTAVVTQMTAPDPVGSGGSGGGPPGTSSPPSTPQRPAASGSVRRIRFRWLAPLSQGSDAINDYRVEWSRCGFTSACRSHALTAVATRAIITNLTAGHRYYVRVRAESAAGHSPYTKPVSAMVRVG